MWQGSGAERENPAVDAIAALSRFPSSTCCIQLTAAVSFGCWRLTAAFFPGEFPLTDCNFLSQVRRAPASLRSSVVAVPCKLGLMIGDSAIELCSRITMGMTGSQSSRGQMAGSKVAVLVKVHSRWISRLCSKRVLKLPNARWCFQNEINGQGIRVLLNVYHQSKQTMYRWAEG